MAIKKSVIYHHELNSPVFLMQNFRLRPSKLFTKILSIFGSVLYDKIIYCHNNYAFHNDISMVDCFKDYHWEHIRKSDNAFFLHENTQEGCDPNKILKELQIIIETKFIDPKKIFVLVMDPLHEAELKRKLEKASLKEVRVDNWNYYLYDLDILNVHNWIDQPFENKIEMVEASDKKFSIFNRRFKSERLYFFFDLVKNDLLKHFLYTFHNIHPHLYGVYDKNDLKNFITSEYKEKIKEIYEWIDGVPYTEDADSFLNLSPKYIFDMIKSTDINVVLETNYNYLEQEHVKLISEKTYKVILCKKPFIMYSRHKTLEGFRQMGYKTFSPFIDESYDLVEDDVLRRQAIIKEIQRIVDLPNSEYKLLLEQCKSITEFNYNVLKDYVFEPLTKDFEELNLFENSQGFYKLDDMKFEENNKQVYKLT